MELLLVEVENFMRAVEDEAIEVFEYEGFSIELLNVKLLEELAKRLFVFVVSTHRDTEFIREEEGVEE